MSLTLRYLLLGALLLAAACRVRPESSDPGVHGALAAEEASAPASQDATSPSPSHAEHGAGREPQALLPIMLGMSADIAGVMQALWLDDYEALSARARHLADHAPISAAEVARIRSVLGAELEAFEAADGAVHEAAVRMSKAADARDVDGLLKELTIVQRGCVACHNTFRNRLRTTAR